MGALTAFVGARTVDRHVVSPSAARGEGGEGDGSGDFGACRPGRGLIA
jgi:hypothetical protein